MTFRLRLIVAAAVAVVAGILATAAAAYFVVHHDLYQTVDLTLARRAEKVVAAEPSTRILPTDRSPLVSVVQVLDAAGHVVATTPGQPRLPVGSRATAVAEGHHVRFYATLTTGGQSLRVLTSPLRHGGAVQVGAPLAAVSHQLHDLAIFLGLASAAGIAVALALGWVVSRTALGPLTRLTTAIERAANTVDLSQRVRTTSRDELGRLGSHFDRLLDALEGSRIAQRRLVEDAAHELRTPLTSLQTNAEVMTRANELSPEEHSVVAQAMLSQLHRLDSLVNDLVELAQDEAPDATIEDLRLDEIVAAVAEHARGHALAKQVSIEASLEPGKIRGDRTRIQRAIANLVDNAIKWSPSGATVEVNCVGTTVTVRDHGPGIDPADLPHIFDRFYRAADARRLPGSGLGLAIVRQVVEADGGRVDTEAPEGGGTLMRITLPASQHPRAGHS